MFNVFLLKGRQRSLMLVSLLLLASYTLTVSAQSSSSDEFALVTSVSDFVEGDYIIVYNNGAMNTTVSSDRLQYTEVTPMNNVITTTDATIIWHIAQCGSYYTIYNASENKYAASNGTKNLAQLLVSGTDDKSLWSVTKGATFEFVNKYNSASNVNANLRRNGTYGFACYSTQTGGALSLYKRTAYYQNADGKTGAELKTAMCGIILPHTQRTYDNLWTDFQTTDKRSDGKVWDMYSNITNFTFGTDQAGNYSKEGDVYNREHSFPKSWFGNGNPMYTDLHHMYPTDAKVNGMRSNYPFGETNGEEYKSANDFSKLGACTYPGYTGTVFEPADEYKGDFARTYFYMVTCYEDQLPSWYSNYSDARPTLDGNKYPGLKTWQLNMLMEWAKNDPVSEKEINRNNAVYSIQHNRNPFIDYPGLEEYIWGTMTTTAFSYDNYVQPVYNDDPEEPTYDSNIYELVTDDNTLAAGDKILIAYVNGTTAKALGTTQNTNNRAAVDVTKNGDNTLTPGNDAQVINLEKNGSNFLFNVGNGYLYAASSGDNYLRTETTADANAKATISISDGNATITFQGGNTRNTIRYNPNNNSPIFSCYASNTTTGSAPQIYRMIPTITLANATSNTSTISTYNGKTFNVTLANRTLVKDGKWNTLCLPFSMTAVQVSAQLAPTELKELDVTGTYDGHQTSLTADGTLYLYFKGANAIEAGKPYIVKWDNGIDLENPTFNGVTINNASTEVSFSGGRFVGSYNPVNFTANDYSKLFLGADNTLYYPNDAMTVGACRAYFDLGANKARAFVLNFGDDAEETGIISQSKESRRQGDGGWYTLDGRKVDVGAGVKGDLQSPVPARLPKGIYIHNGKKAVIK